MQEPDRETEGTGAEHRMKTKMILVSAPSGAGKSSFVERICREDSRLVDTITFTTRSLREGELQGSPYFFVDRQEFEKKIQENYFAEWARVHGNLYGTPVHQLLRAWEKGLAVIMDIDVQGAASLRGKYPGARSVFILPPSLEELRRRVIRRDGKVPSDLDLRMKNAEIEISRAGEFDVQLVNNQFDESFAEFKKVIDLWLSET